MISWWGWSDANRARASPALMVAIARRLITCVDVPLLGRLEEDERGARERKPTLAVEAARVVACCWVLLEAAWRASLRRTLADAMVEVFDKRVDEGWGDEGGFVRETGVFNFSRLLSLHFSAAPHENRKSNSNHSNSKQHCLLTLECLLFLSPSSKFKMGVPAGPKLDFVGASEVRDQETWKCCASALKFVLVDTFIFTLRWRNQKGNYLICNAIVVKTQLF